MSTFHFDFIVIFIEKRRLYDVYNIYTYVCIRYYIWLYIYTQQIPASEKCQNEKRDIYSIQSTERAKQQHTLSNVM